MDVDKQYWELVMALAKHDPNQKDNQSTVESCFFPGIIQDDQSLQERIDETDITLDEIMEEASSLILQIQSDNFHSLRKAYLKGIIYAARAFREDSAPINQVLEEVYGLPGITYIDDDEVLDINSQIDTLIPTEIRPGTFSERYLNYADRFRTENILDTPELADTLVREMFDKVKSLTAEKFGQDFIPDDSKIKFIITQVKHYAGRFIFGGPDTSVYETVLKVGDPDTDKWEIVKGIKSGLQKSDRVIEVEF